jgi:hypothetical protein
VATGRSAGVGEEGRRGSSARRKKTAQLVGEKEEDGGVVTLKQRK